MSDEGPLEWLVNLDLKRVKPHVVTNSRGEIGLALFVDDEVVGVLSVDSVRRFRDHLNELIEEADRLSKKLGPSLRASLKAPFN